MPMNDLYGFPESALETVRASVEQALGIALVKHNTIYRGEHYVCGECGAETFLLQANWEAIDGELMEDQFPDMGVLLYVHSSDRTTQIERLLTSRTSARLLARQQES
jgi:hypothetical protein